MTPQTPSPRYVGWVQPKDGHAWHAAVSADDFDECRRMVLDFPGHKRVLPAGVHPNDKPPRRAGLFDGKGAADDRDRGPYR
jgi:hypothetical protein